MTNFTIITPENLNQFRDGGIFEQQQESLLANKADFCSGLENNTDFVDELSNEFFSSISKENSPEKLHQLLNALCIDVYAVGLLKDYTQAKIAIREHFCLVSKNPLIKTIEDDQNCFVFASESIQTIEGIEFYFPYALNLYEGQPLSKEDVKNVELASQSENPEVKNAANWLLWMHRNPEKQYDLSQLASTIGCFIRSSNRFFQDSKNKQALQILGQSQLRTQWINDMNGDLLDDLINNQPVSPFFELDHPTDSALQVRLQAIELWKIGTDKRMRLFTCAQDRLKSIRDQKKTGRLEFTQAYMNSNLPFLPMGYADYISRVQALLPKQEEVAVASEKKQKPEKKTASGKTAKKPKNKKNNSKPISNSNRESHPSSDSKAEKTLKDPEISHSFLDAFRKPLRFQYAPRVLEWFSEDPSHLHNDSYASLDPAIQKKQIVFHSFSQAVDEYVLSCGFEVPHANQTFGGIEKAFCVAGLICFESKEVEMGLFVYTISKEDGQIYHRYFSKKDYKELIECASPKLRQAMEFPTPLEGMEIEKETHFVQKELKMKNHSEDHVSYNSILKSITILDQKNSVKIILFQAQK